MPRPYRIYGHTLSFFTRKLTGYMSYKGLPWLQRTKAYPDHVLASDWPGGMPVVETPDGDIIWDTTSIILHLEERYRQHAVLPEDETLRFLCFAIEDFCDEWLYRCGPPTRWYFEENAQYARWEIGREASIHRAVSRDEAGADAEARLKSSTPPFGATPQNVQCWVDDVLRPWQRAVGKLLQERSYLFGERPSLADFAIYGGNEAHFNREPLCRRWLEADAPRLVDHTHRLFEPEDQDFGDWCRVDDIPDALIALLAEIGRHYLPWVSQATVDGQAVVRFTSCQSVNIAVPDFFKRCPRHAARAIRLVAERTPGCCPGDGRNPEVLQGSYGPGRLAARSVSAAPPAAQPSLSLRCFLGRYRFIANDCGRRQVGELILAQAKHIAQHGSVMFAEQRRWGAQLCAAAIVAPGGKRVWLGTHHIALDFAPEAALDKGRIV